MHIALFSARANSYTLPSTVRYKAHNTGEQLAGLNNVNLVNLGIGDKDLRKGVLTAIKHAGYTAPRSTDRNELAQDLMERHQKATDELLKAGPAASFLFILTD